ncbi:MAG: HAMP domain-containing sensor histidine kinase [Actinomycetota bacterium]
MSRRLTTRAKITIGVAAVLIVAALVLGVVVVRSVRTTQLDQVDARLIDVATNPANPPGDLGARPQPEAPPDQVDTVDVYRAFASVAFDADGAVVRESPSGFAEDVEPLPDLSEVDLDDLINNPTTVPSSDGTFDYRAVAISRPGGMIVVTAESLQDEDDALAQLQRNVVISSIAVVLVAAVAVWFVIGRAFRPIDRMIDTAGDIAGGDLSQRIDHPEDATELGRLAGALDDMIDQLDGAFAERAESEQRLRRFAADASHELRTPIAAIHGYAELYRHGGIPSGEPLDRAISRIESESERMGQLVEDLLVLARLDQHRTEDRAPVDISAITVDAAHDLQAIEPERTITVDAPAPATVLGDEQQLRQVVANLATNARVHTPSGTAIHLAVHTTDGAVELTVADEGPGVAPAARNHVFERFFRADKSRKVGEGGSGLGLSIVAGVVEAHGGGVRLDDTRENGAAFVVTLPAASATAATDQDVEPTTPSVTASG